jgi:hypothetical protein
MNVIIETYRKAASIAGGTRRRGTKLIGTAAMALSLAGCVQAGVDTYDEFRSAVDSGATCRQLIDIQQNFVGTPDEDRIATDLEEIGCRSPDSVRTDEDAG